jgi:predicted membrane protein
MFSKFEESSFAFGNRKLRTPDSLNTLLHIRYFLFMQKPKMTYWQKSHNEYLEILSMNIIWTNWLIVFTLLWFWSMTVILYQSPCSYYTHCYAQNGSSRSTWLWCIMHVKSNSARDQTFKETQRSKQKIPKFETI